MKSAIIQGDALAELARLPGNSVDCCITSPPYYQLRDYGVDGQIGLEETVEEYIDKLVTVFREVKRILRRDGTLWINIADSYAKTAQAGYKAKDLLGIPWLLALALRADGWYLRQDIIWNKPNTMPESVTDRCTKSHEYLLLLSKSSRYYFDYKAIEEPCASGNNYPPAGSAGSIRPNSRKRGVGNRRTFRGGGAYTHDKAFDNTADVNNETRGNVPNESGLRRKRDVWTVAIKGSKYHHFATFPPQLVIPCVLAGSRAGGTVLDPFAGTGTVGTVARENGREYILIDLARANVEICKSRLEG